MVKNALLFIVVMAAMIIMGGLGLGSLLTTQVSREAKHLMRVHEELKKERHRQEENRRRIEQDVPLKQPR